MRELPAHPLLRGSLECRRCAGCGKACGRFRPLVPMSNGQFIAFIDGGARGNPGPAGWGAQILDHDGAVVAELHGSIGRATNNVAEYHGLLETLRWCLSNQATRVDVKSDSLLLVQQMRGAYKVKNEGLK